VVGAQEFFPLVRPALKLKCELEIQLLLNHEVASVLTRTGDLDNRLKTLFDGLRCPQSQQEISRYKPTDIDLYWCLLEDDALIAALRIETHRNFAAPLSAPADHVRLNMMVTIEPVEYDVVTRPFQGD
jgi:hypothetical protein